MAELQTVNELVNMGPDEYKSNPIAWVHAIELVEYCLETDVRKKTIMGQTQKDGHAEKLRETIDDNPVTGDEFQSIIDNAYEPKKKWKENKSDNGSFDLDSFLNNEETCFIEEQKQYDTGRAVSIVYDIAVSSAETRSNFMVERHKKVYELVSSLESQRRPVRVIAIMGTRCDDVGKNGIHFIVIKDYTDQIFNGIWGAFTNNVSTNIFCNVVQENFLGTSDWGNGSPCECSIGEFFPDDELIIFSNGRIHE